MISKNQIIKKIEKVALVGRGGASFPVTKKWLAVKNNLKTDKKAYIIVNAAEGEPSVKKDAWLLANKPEEIIYGIFLAWDFLGKDKVDKIYFYLSKNYYQKYGANLKKVLAHKKYNKLNKKIEFFLKPKEPTYISGEESAVLNIIEAKRAEPRLRPPFPADKGLFNKPTLLHNLETFYDVALVMLGTYEANRLYTLTGAVKNKGVFSLPANLNIEEILKITDNYPTFDFFVLTGGGVCGELWRQDQLQAPVSGSGLVMIYDKKNTNQEKLIEYWLKFYQVESCGACSACREGSYRLRELFQEENTNQSLFRDLLDNLDESSLCALGPSLSLTLKSYLENIYKK